MKYAILTLAIIASFLLGQQHGTAQKPKAETIQNEVHSKAVNGYTLALSCVSPDTSIDFDGNSKELTVFCQ